ncbi:MAG: hypothetical protein JNN20_09335 [Betaproteobacteria bacterium]|nr:hypothetical protein [Betaproteobacteria bacterium]
MVLLAGCAIDPAYVAYRQKQDALGKYATLTGSLSNGDSTPHTLKIVGNKEYNDNRVVNSVGNDISLQVPKKPGKGEL